MLGHQEKMILNFVWLSGLISLAMGNYAVVTREYVWHNFKAFTDYGWVEYYPGTTKSYSTPSELDLRLYDLNNNFTDEVWGRTRREAGKPSIRYQIDLTTKPEYCGMINATASFKFYLEESTILNGYRPYVYPVHSNGPHPTHHYLDNSNFASWSTKTVDLVISGFRAYNALVFDAIVAPTGLVLLDEVRLTYTVQQGLQNCPNSCSHDCKYRGIDCHNYYTCIDRRYKEFRTCNKTDGLAFNPIIKSCDLIENVEGCHDRKPRPVAHCVCEYRPHERDCRRYYYCPDTCRLELCEELRCPGGLLWSMDAKGDGSGQQQCAPAGKASCFNGTSPMEDIVLETTVLEQPTSEIANRNISDSVFLK